MNTSNAQLSDARKKKDVREVDPKEADRFVAKAIPITFLWRDDYDETRHVGLLAQQIEEIRSDLVILRQDGYKAIKYDEVFTLLLASHQRLTRRVEELAKHVEDLCKGSENIP